MLEPFVGQITLYAFPFAPSGWAFCNGAVLQVQQSQALYALIGNLYGGNNTAFNLPDLRGRTPIGSGPVAPGGPFTSTSFPIGIAGVGGQETFNVPATALPLHNHTMAAQAAQPTQLSPAGGMFGRMPSNGNPPISGLYTTESTTQAAMAASAIGNAGGNAAADNRQPSIALNYCIATLGVWPSRP